MDSDNGMVDAADSARRRRGSVLSEVSTAGETERSTSTSPRAQRGRGRRGRTASLRDEDAGTEGKRRSRSRRKRARRRGSNVSNGAAEDSWESSHESLPGRPPRAAAVAGSSSMVDDPRLSRLHSRASSRRSSRASSARRRVRLKCYHKGHIRLVAVTLESSFRTLHQRLCSDYGFEVALRYEDVDGDLITLASQNDLFELLEHETGTVTVHVSEAAIVDVARVLQSPTPSGPRTGLQLNPIPDHPAVPVGKTVPKPPATRMGSARAPRTERPKLTPLATGGHDTSRHERGIRWQRGQMLGQGAFGTVYLGMNLESGELMAIKQLDANSLSIKDAQALENEVNTMRELTHDNIVRYLGTDRQGKTLSIFMEYVPGGSIRQLLERFGSFEESVIRVYTRQLLLGLEALHRNGIAHRDIKGANVLVANDGTIKLADFGASKRLGSASITQTGVKGTPQWMAPEVIREQQESKGWKKADVWSVACTVIEMATGRPPWSQYSNPVTAMYHIACQDSLPTFPDNLSEQGLDFLKRCFQRDPSLRPDVTSLLLHPFVTAIQAHNVRHLGRSSFPIGRPATAGHADRPVMGSRGSQFMPPASPAPPPGTFAITQPHGSSALSREKPPVVNLEEEAEMWKNAEVLDSLRLSTARTSFSSRKGSVPFIPTGPPVTASAPAVAPGGTGGESTGEAGSGSGSGAAPPSTVRSVQPLLRTPVVTSSSGAEPAGALPSVEGSAAYQSRIPQPGFHSFRSTQGQQLTGRRTPLTTSPRAGGAASPTRAGVVDPYPSRIPRPKHPTSTTERRADTSPDIPALADPPEVPKLKLASKAKPVLPAAPSSKHHKSGRSRKLRRAGSNRSGKSGSSRSRKGSKGSKGSRGSRGSKRRPKQSSGSARKGPRDASPIVLDGRRGPGAVKAAAAGAEDEAGTQAAEPEPVDAPSESEIDKGHEADESAAGEDDDEEEDDAPFEFSITARATKQRMQPADRPQRRGGDLSPDGGSQDDSPKSGVASRSSSPRPAAQQRRRPHALSADMYGDGMESSDNLPRSPMAVKGRKGRNGFRPRDAARESLEGLKSPVVGTSGATSPDVPFSSPTRTMAQRVHQTPIRSARRQAPLKKAGRPRVSSATPLRHKHKTPGNNGRLTPAARLGRGIQSPLRAASAAPNRSSAKKRRVGSGPPSRPTRKFATESMDGALEALSPQNVEHEQPNSDIEVEVEGEATGGTPASHKRTGSGATVAEELVAAAAAHASSPRGAKGLPSSPGAGHNEVEEQINLRGDAMDDEVEERLGAGGWRTGSLSTTGDDSNSNSRSAQDTGDLASVITSVVGEGGATVSARMVLKRAHTLKGHSAAVSTASLNDMVARQAAFHFGASPSHRPGKPPAGDEDTFGVAAGVVVTSAIDGSASVWDVAKGRELATVIHSVSNKVQRADTSSRFGGGEYHIKNTTARSPPGDSLESSFEFGLRGAHVAARSPSPGGQWPSPPRPLKMAATEQPAKQSVPAGTVRVTAAVVVPFTSLLLTGTSDGCIWAWDTSSNERLRRLSGHTSAVKCIAFHTDAMMGKALGAPSVRAFSRARSRGRHHGKKRQSKKAVLAGIRVASGSEDQTVRVWDLSQRQRCQMHVLRGHTGIINDVTFIPNSWLVASCAADGTICLWDVRTGHRKFELEGHLGAVKCIVVVPPETMAASAKVPGRRTAGGRARISASGHAVDSPVAGTVDDDDDDARDGMSVVTDITGGGMSPRTTASRVSIGLVGTGKAVTSQSGISGMAVGTGSGSGSGTSSAWLTGSAAAGLLSGARDGKIKLWNLETGKCVRTLRGHARSVVSLQLPPAAGSVSDESFFAFAGGVDLGGRLATPPQGGHERRESTATILTQMSGATSTFKFPADASVASGEGFTPRSVVSSTTTASQSPRAAPHHVGHVVSCSADGTLRLWNYQTGRALRMFEGHKGPVTCVRWAMYNIVASGGADGTIRVWNVNNGLCVRVIKPTTSSSSVTALDWKGEWLVGAYRSGGVEVWRWEEA